MMKIGTIVALPAENSRWATVKDEHGSRYTVDAGELPEEAQAGDELAYRVDFFSGSGSVTLKRTEPEE